MHSRLDQRRIPRHARDSAPAAGATPATCGSCWQRAANARDKWTGFGDAARGERAADTGNAWARVGDASRGQRRSNARHEWAGSAGGD